MSTLCISFCANLIPFALPVPAIPVYPNIIKYTTSPSPKPEASAPIYIYISARFLFSPRIGKLALVNGVVARQLLQAVVQTNVLGRRRSLGLLVRSLAGAVAADVEAAATRVGALATGARLHGVLQAVLVRPAVEEVAVEAVAGGVAVGVDPAAEVLGRDLAHVVVELIEDGHNGDGVRLGADAAVVVAKFAREGHL